MCEPDQSFVESSNVSEPVKDAIDDSLNHQDVSVHLIPNQIVDRVLIVICPVSFVSHTEELDGFLCGLPKLKEHILQLDLSHSELSSKFRPVPTSKQMPVEVGLGR